MSIILLNKNKKQILIFILFAFIFLARQNCAMATWEVVKAKTVVEDIVESPEIIQEENLQDNFDEDLPNYTKENSFGEAFAKRVKKIFKRKEVLDEEQTNKIQDETLKDEFQVTKNAAEFGDDVLKQTTVQTEQKVEEKNKFKINADRITYDDAQAQVIAKGHVEIIAKAQDVILKADTAVLDNETQTIKLYDNVKIVKDNAEMFGEYLVVDLNEENILMDNPTYNTYSFQIIAQEGYLIANDIQMLNGTVKSDKETEYPIISRGFMRIDNLGDEFKFDDPKKIKDKKELKEKARESNQRKTYQINTKEIILTSFKDHNSFEMKDVDIYYNGRRIIRKSDIEIVSDKKFQTTETASPELGNFRGFGSYVGYGFVQKLPKGQILKLMPVLAYSDSNIGVGAIVKHRTRNSFFEGGWNSASENFVVRGKYRFSNPLMLTYGRNAYMPEGFLGARRSGYAAQLQYLKSYNMKEYDLRFNHGVYAGVFSDYQKRNQEDAYSTTRFRYIAGIRKRLASYYNEEQDFSASLNALAQGAATVYGSGETVGILRFGPYITTNFKRWESNIGYILAGVHGDSPFVFDKYRYGKASFIVNEKFHFTDNFALGFRLFVTPGKDNYERDLLTECRFYTIIGPRDLKVALSYDFVRAIARMDLMFLIGSKTSKIDFEKLTTKNIDDGENKYDFYVNPKPIKIIQPVTKGEQESI